MTNYVTFNDYTISQSNQFFLAEEFPSSDGTSDTVTPASDMGEIYTGTTGENGTLVFQSTNMPGQVTVSNVVPDGNGGTTSTQEFLLTQSGYQSNGQILFHDSNGSPMLLSNTQIAQLSNGQYPSTVLTDNGTATFNTAIACFTKGALIRTADGDRPIESLSVGDLVLTATGEQKAITWVGHRLMRFVGANANLDGLPIQISANAFGPGLPFADLIVSPGHAMAFDVVGTVLVPAKSLLNGSTIRQLDVKSVTYYHIELEEHGIVIANGVGAESFINVGNRSFFANTETVDLAANPDDAARMLSDYCAPFYDNGVIVEAVRAQIARRAETLGWTQSYDLLSGIRLDVDGKIVSPHVRGAVAKFLVPADAHSIRILSTSNVPGFLGINADNRKLGVYISKITLSDGFSAERNVAMNDPCLSDGFHVFEETGSRWTDGNASLPTALFDGMDGTVMLSITSAGSLPTWTQNVAEDEVQESVAA